MTPHDCFPRHAIGAMDAADSVAADETKSLERATSSLSTAKRSYWDDRLLQTQQPS